MRGGFTLSTQESTQNYVLNNVFVSLKALSLIPLLSFQGNWLVCM